MKALYAANNGRPFVASPTMRDRGLLARDNTSGEAIRAWLAATRAGGRRDHAAQPALRLLPPGARRRPPPVGAANVPLPPGARWRWIRPSTPMGELLWIDARRRCWRRVPAYRRLVTALDTGGAIKGDVRADLYLGRATRPAPRPAACATRCGSTLVPRVPRRETAAEAGGAARSGAWSPPPSIRCRPRRRHAAQVGGPDRRPYAAANQPRRSRPRARRRVTDIEPNRRHRSPRTRGHRRRLDLHGLDQDAPVRAEASCAAPGRGCAPCW
jgi:hypothetical protein